MTFTCRRGSVTAPIPASPPTPYRLSGMALRALRLAKGATLERAARHIGAVSLMSGLTDIENGSRPPSAVLTMQQFQEYLDWLNSLPDTVQ